MGRPTGADFKIVGPDAEGSGDENLFEEEVEGFAGNEDAMGTPSRAAADVATGRVDEDAEGFGDAGAAGGGVAATQCTLDRVMTQTAWMTHL